MLKVPAADALVAATSEAPMASAETAASSLVLDMPFLSEESR
jgi:hypothetical protein